MMMPLLRALVAATGLALLGGNAFAQAPADANWPASERLMSEYKAGRYAAVIAEAPTVLQSEPWNNELRLAYGYSLLWTGAEWPALEQFQRLLDTDVGVDARLGLANGLAWSGRMSEALPHYRLLLNGPHAGEAKLGLANALRWMGRDDLALPLYRELRAAYPDKDVGEEGLFFARRAVRARTTVGFNYSHDNAPMTRHEPFVAHSWRMFDNSVLFALEASGGRDRGTFVDEGVREDFRYDRREYGVRIETFDLPLAPQLVLSRRVKPGDDELSENAGVPGLKLPARTFGELRLKLTDWPLQLHVGRVNWGKSAFTGAAQLLALEADRIGIEGRYQLNVGELRGQANHYRVKQGPITDLLRYDADNTIDAGDVRLALRWRPWGREVKPFVGTAWRYSDRTDPAYWSPRKYLLGYVGLEGEWVTREWSVTLLGQVGFRMQGEASTSVSGAIIAKRWIADDWAIAVNASAQSGSRESKYRADAISVALEKLW
jgi:tetratricopeptide (TPR) repeat protein